MKKRISLIALAMLIFAIVFTLSACAGEKTPDTSTPDVTTETTTTAPVTTAAPLPCEVHTFEQTEEIPALALRDGEKKFVCSVCGEENSEIIPATKSLKVLAIGNSFSTDAVKYLWNICKNAGVTELVVGNLSIGGCSLDTHYSHIQKGDVAYSYYKNTKGYSVDSSMSIQAALADEDWDFITLQQVSQNAGKPGTFTRLDEIVAFVSETCPDATILWHMTWAYQQDSTHGGFSGYDKDQMTMYNAIVKTTQTEIPKHSQIKGVIPSGTAIQNVRTSTVGDTLTRDGYHLGEGLGRYIVGVTWFAVLTGGDVSIPYYYPSVNAYKKEVQDSYHIVAEAVQNALEFPFEVSQSQYYY